MQRALLPIFPTGTCTAQTEYFSIAWLCLDNIVANACVCVCIFVLWFVLVSSNLMRLTKSFLLPFSVFIVCFEIEHHYRLVVVVVRCLFWGAVGLIMLMLSRHRCRYKLAENWNNSCFTVFNQSYEHISKIDRMWAKNKKNKNKIVRYAPHIPNAPWQQSSTYHNISI